MRSTINLAAWRRWIGVFFVVMPLVQSPLAQSPVGEPDLAISLAKLTNSDWEVRQAGFYGILAVAASGRFAGRTWEMQSTLAQLFKRFPDREEEIRLALMRLLGTEEPVFRSSRGHTEDYGNYVGDLIAAVAAIRDRRAVPALITLMETGNTVTRALAYFGKDSLQQVLRHAASSSMLRRNAVTRTLAQMLEADNRERLDATSLVTVKAALLKAIRDDDRFVRISALQGLALLPGADITATIRGVAEGDPFRLAEDARGGVVYPVRDEAKRILRARTGRSSG